MTDAMKSVYRNYVQISSQIKNLLHEQTLLKQQIMANHNGAEIICEDGFQSKISHCTKKTPLIPAIQELLGHDIPETCFSVTPYDALRVQILEN